MHTSHRKPPARVVVSASLLLIGSAAAVSASAADGAQANGSRESCSEEVRRVAVMPKAGNPKFAQLPRYESRSVQVCDGKVVSRTERNASNQSSGARGNDGA